MGFYFFLKYETIVRRNGLSHGYSEQDRSSVHSSTQFFLISGHQKFKREITNFDDLIFEDINADAVRNKRESEDSESSEKSSEESSETETESEAPGI